jgi:hypothetical protein
MSAILGFVTAQAQRYPANRPPAPPFGTFEVSRQSSSGSAKYVVPDEAACLYLRELKKLVKAEKVSGLAEAVRTTLLRVGCGD